MDSQARRLALCSALISLSLFTTASLAADYSANSYKGEYYKGQPEPLVKPLYDGLYLGIAGGFDSYRIHPNINVSFNGDTVTGNPVLNATGFAGGIFGGFGLNLNRLFYLGGEALVNNTGAQSISTFNDIDSTSTYSTQFTVKTSFGFSINPGLRLNASTLVYARAGLAWAYIQDTENFTAMGALSSTYSANWTRGTMVGLGVESAIYKALSLRTEFTHFNYNTSSYTPFGSDYAPSDNQFMLGLVYHII